MTLVRKILFWAFIFLAVGAAVWAYISVKNSKKPKVNAVSVLPDSCLVYLNTNNFFELVKKINAQSLVFDKLKSYPGIDELCETLQLFDSLVRSNNELQEELNENTLHLGVYGKTSDWLLAFNIKELGAQARVNTLVGKIFLAGTEEGDVLLLKVKKGTTCFFSLQSGVALLSSSKTLLNKAMDQSSAKFVKSAKYLELQNSLSESNLLSTYVNHELYAASPAASRLNLSVHCKRGCSAGAVEIEPSEIKITGFASLDSSEVLSVLANEATQSPDELMPLLPADLISFKAYGFGVYGSLGRKISSRYGKLHDNYWKDMNEEALFNLKNEFEANLKDHLLSFKTSRTASYAAIKVSDSIRALEHLKLMSDTAFSSSGENVYRLKCFQEDPLVLLQPLHEAPTRYACYYASHLLFAESREALEALLGDYHNRLLARNDLNFVAYKNQNFTDEYNFLFYTSPALNMTEVSSFFNFVPGSKTGSVEGFRHFSYALINDQKNFRFRLQLLNEPENSSKMLNNLWAFKLDSTSSCKPFGFVNHLSKENEVFVQDDKNNIYLVNAKSKLLWKKNIAEKILSEIYMVDAFKNNKYQLLFSSKNYLHLIDRNGDYVKGYPVKLPAEATSPLCLFDYEGNKDYRLFIACKNNFIYNYAIEGALNEGFKNVKTEKEVRLPVQYVKVGKSDYLITVDVEGKIYTFSRKGETRISLKNRTIANCSSFYVDAATNIANSYLVYVDDKSGAINKISLSDRKEIVNLNYESESTRAKYTLVDNNREMDFITTHNRNILAYDLNGGLLMNKDTGEELGDADFYSDEAHTLYYALLKEKKSLLVYKPLKQRILQVDATSMPLISELFGDKKKYLIVTNGSWLNCQLIN